MAGGFDPYHAWLGLPPGRPPAHYYDLLGIKLFQSEPPIIAEAADQRIGRVKAQLLGPHSAVARQLLDQLTKARAELLSPASKGSYDAQLRARLGLPPAPENKRPAAALPPTPQQLTQQLPQPASTVAMTRPPSAATTGTVPSHPLTSPPAVAPTVPHVAAVVRVAAAVMAGPAPVMQGYGPGGPLVQSVMPGYSAAPANALENISAPRRRRRRESSGLLALCGLLAIVAAVAAVGYAYRERLIDAIKDTPQVASRQDEEHIRTNPDKRPTAPGHDGTGPKAADTATGKQPFKKQAATKVPMPPAQEQSRPPEHAGRKAKPAVPPTPTSIKPQSPEEKAAVGRLLSAARTALAERNWGKADEHLSLAMLQASSAAGLAAVDGMRTLRASVNEFWRAVAESCKGLKPVDELEIGDKRMIVIDSDAEHLSLRADGQVRNYKLEALPAEVALYLAEQWLQPGAHESKVVLGAFLAVDPAGNQQRAQQLWREAADQGSEVAQILLAQSANQD